MSDEGVFTGGSPPPPTLKCCGVEMPIEKVHYNGKPGFMWRACQTCGLIFHARKLWFFEKDRQGFVINPVAQEWVHGPCLENCACTNHTDYQISKICSTIRRSK